MTGRTEYIPQFVASLLQLHVMFFGPTIVLVSFIVGIRPGRAKEGHCLIYPNQAFRLRLACTGGCRGGGLLMISLIARNYSVLVSSFQDPESIVGPLSRFVLFVLHM